MNCIFPINKTPILRRNGQQTHFEPMMSYPRKLRVSGQVKVENITRKRRGREEGVIFVSRAPDSLGF